MKFSIIFLTMLFAAFCLTLSLNTRAEEYTSESQWYVETDPTVLFFNGCALAFRKSATFNDSLHVGMGFYQAELPEFFIDQNSNNKNKGWEIESQAMEFFADYFLHHPNEGLSVGVSMSVYQFDIARNNQTAQYLSLGGQVRAGYLWRPVKSLKSLYVYPWVGIAKDTKVEGENKIDGEVFETPDWSLVPSFQLGFSF